jgi:hypothetical protein
MSLSPTTSSSQTRAPWTKVPLSGCGVNTIGGVSEHVSASPIVASTSEVQLREGFESGFAVVGIGVGETLGKTSLQPFPRPVDPRDGNFA